MKSQEDLATENGVSVKAMQNYKRLASSIPEMQELLNTGKVTPTTALAIMRQLSEEEQEPQTGRPEAFRSCFTGKCACVYQNDGEGRTEANRWLFRLYDFPIS